MESINKTISDAKDAVKELIKKAHEKQLEAEPGRTMMESFENKVNEVIVCVFDMDHLLFYRSFNQTRTLSLSVELFNISPFSFYSRFSKRLVMMLEAVRRRACLKATI